MIGLIQKHLGTMGADIKWASELRTHGRARADIALLVDSDLIAIEAKLGDSHRAIAQATLNRFWFDRSYVALWFETISRGVEAEARRHGIGIIAVHPDTIVVHRKAPLSRASRSMRKQVLSNLEETLS
jgi:hypothetical protein